MTAACIPSSRVPVEQLPPASRLPSALLCLLSIPPFLLLQTGYSSSCPSTAEGQSTRWSEGGRPAASAVCSVLPALSREAGDEPSSLFPPCIIDCSSKLPAAPGRVLPGQRGRCTPCSQGASPAPWGGLLLQGTFHCALVRAFPAEGFYCWRWAGGVAGISQSCRRQLLVGGRRARREACCRSLGWSHRWLEGHRGFNAWQQPGNKRVI